MSQQHSTDASWAIVNYEAQMLFKLCGLINAEDFDTRQPLVANAIVESTCLHMRILIDILLSSDSGKGDDIRLDQLIPGFQHDSVNRLRTAWGKPNEVDSPRWTLNKMIAHPTTKRKQSHDYTGLIKGLLPLVEELWRALQEYLSRPARTLPTTTGGLNPWFRAKTSS
jgi:hypothetical protein